MKHIAAHATLKGAIAGIIWSVIGIVAGSVVFASPVQTVLASSSAQSAAQQTATLNYGNLPGAVVDAIPSVVALRRVISDTAANGVANGLVASGVIVDDSLVLTAGHNVAENGRLSCGRTEIDTAAGKGGNPSQEQAQLGAAMYGSSDDIALLQVNASANFRNQPHARIATALPQPGEAVYFVNFQPDADGNLRSPLRHDGGNLSRPVVFKGIVLGVSGTGYTIATNLGAGNRTGDNILRKGGSGGAVLNGHGQLVGLSVSTDSLSADHGAGMAAATYGVRLPAGLYQYVHAQAVTRSTIGDLRTSFAACH